MAKKRAVVLRGIHLAVHPPTEDLLTVQIEGLFPDKFRAIAEDLEDWFAVVDDAYKKTYLKGRGWRGGGRKITKTKRTRRLKFSPFPSCFSNTLRSIRRRISEQRVRQCLVLEGERRGRSKMNIYILPYAHAPSFMSFIETQNKEIDELNMQIKEFKKTGYFKDVKEILERHHVRLNLDTDWSLRHIGVDVTPLALEPTTVKELVETEYKKMFEHLTEEERRMTEKLAEEERRGLEALQRELERKRKELVVKGIENIQSKIDTVVRRIVGAKKLDPKKVKGELERLRRIATSVGLEAVASTVIDPLVDVVEKPERTMEIFGTKNLSDGVSGRIKGLIDSL